MKIAVIGAGKAGKALGGAFVRAGYSVVYASKSGESAAKTAAETGGTAAGSVRQAAEGADVVVLAVYYAAAGREVATEIAPVVEGKVVIDVSNPVKPDVSGLVTEGGPSAAENYASWMPGAHVVKAFNTIFSSVHGDPKAHGVMIDALFAADDEGARATVAELLRSIGFRPVYVGPLVRARELEAIGFLNIALQMSAQGDWRSAFNLVGAPKSSVA